MTWINAAGRVLLISALSLLLGWFYGYPVLALTLALLCLIGVWLYQLQRAQDWLQDPEHVGDLHPAHEHLTSTWQPPTSPKSRKPSPSLSTRSKAS